MSRGFVETFRPMGTSSAYDLAIVGCGAIGSAAFYHASKLGLKVVAVDSFSPPHSFGSSHGDTRIVRRAIGENPLYSVLSQRSYELWEEIEKTTHQKILHKIGCLLLAAENDPHPFLSNTIQAAQRYHVPYQLWDGEEVHRRFPEFVRIQGVHGFYEPEGGMVSPEAVIRSQVALAVQKGGQWVRNTKIIRTEEKNNRVTLTTARGEEMTASKVLLASGPWITQLLPFELHSLFQVYRQVLCWFDYVDPMHFRPGHFPVFLLHGGGHKGGIYGFPALGGKAEGIKLGTHTFTHPIHQDFLSREVHQEEVSAFYRGYIQETFPSIVSPHCLRTAVCSYTLTPDEGFVIDFLPSRRHTLFLSACSGHGFKHSAAMGELGVDLLFDRQPLCDPQIFSHKRFSV